MRLALGYRLRHTRDLVRDWYYSRPRTALHSARTPEGYVLVGTGGPVHRAMQSGNFDEVERRTFLSALENCDRLVDVGANIGVYTAMALSLGHEVFAVEPQALNRRCLESTLKANGWSAEIYPGVLGATQGTALLYGASSSGASLIRGWAGYWPRHQQVVEMTTLDALLRDRFQHERLLIKVDVEGAEADVLAGATETLGRTPAPTWIMEICLREYHPGGNRRYQQTFDYFFNAGYRATAPGSDVTPRDISMWVEQGRAPSITFAFER